MGNQGVERQTSFKLNSAANLKPALLVQYIYVLKIKAKPRLVEVVDASMFVIAGL